VGNELVNISDYTDAYYKLKWKDLPFKVRSDLEAIVDYTRFRDWPSVVRLWQSLIAKSILRVSDRDIRGRVSTAWCISIAISCRGVTNNPLVDSVAVKLFGRLIFGMLTLYFDKSMWWRGFYGEDYIEVINVPPKFEEYARKWLHKVVDRFESSFEGNDIKNKCKFAEDFIILS